MIKTFLRHVIAAPLFAAVLLTSAAPAAQASGYSGGGSAVPSASVPQVPYTSGQIYPFANSSPQQQTLTAQKLNCHGFSVRSPIPPAALGVNITTPVSGAFTSIGIYNASPTTNKATTLLLAVYDIPSGSSGAASLPTSSPPTLQPGTLYKVCIASTGAVAMGAIAPGFVAMTAGLPGYANLPTSSGSATGENTTVTYTASGQTSALPSDLTSASWAVTSGYSPTGGFTAP